MSSCRPQRCFIVSVVLLLVAVVMVFSGCGGGPATGVSSVLEEGRLQEGVVQLLDGSEMKDDTAAIAGPTEPDKVVVAPLAREPEISLAAIQRVMDQDEAEKGGNARYWIRVTGYGWDGDMTYTFVNGNRVENWMRWHSGLSAGTYRVYAYIPRNHATTRSAVYRLEQLRSDGRAWETVANKTVSQYSISDQWVDLGSYRFNGQPAVYLSDATGEPYSTKRRVGFDGIKWVQEGGTPPSDRWGWPLSPWRATTYNFKQNVSGWGYHTSQDAAGGEGTPVYASAAGVVRRARVQTSFGCVVVIAHPSDNVSSVYGHLRARDIKVWEGKSVSKGDLLGYLGNRRENGGWGPHLHFGIRKGTYPSSTWTYSGYLPTAAAVDAAWQNPVNYINNH